MQNQVVGGGGAAVVKLLTCGGKDPVFESGSRHCDFRDWVSRFVWRKYSKRTSWGEIDIGYSTILLHPLPPLAFIPRICYSLPCYSVLVIDFKFMSVRKLWPMTFYAPGIRGRLSFCLSVWYESLFVAILKKNVTFHHNFIFHMRIPCNRTFLCCQCQSIWPCDLDHDLWSIFLKHQPSW